MPRNGLRSRRNGPRPNEKRVLQLQCLRYLERRSGETTGYGVCAPLWRTHLSTKLGADSSPKSTHPGYRRHVGHDLLVRGILLGLLLIHQRDFFGKFPGVSHNGCYNVMYTETKLKIFLSICSPADAAKQHRSLRKSHLAHTSLTIRSQAPHSMCHVGVGVSSGCKKHLEEKSQNHNK